MGLSCAVLRHAAKYEVFRLGLEATHVAANDSDELTSLEQAESVGHPAPTTASGGLLTDNSGRGGGNVVGPALIDFGLGL